MFLHQLLYKIDFIVRRIFHCEVDFIRRFQHRTFVAERQETFLRVIFTHSALTHSTKWQMIITDMQNRVVYTNAA